MRYRLYVPIVALFIWGNSPLSAQPQPKPVDGRILIEMTLHPTATPKPLSKSFLIPQYDEMQPGNRVHKFLWCFMEQDATFSGDISLQRQKYLEMPFNELDASELKDYGNNVARNINRAARLLDVDWQIWFDLRRDGVNTLLPDVQKVRQLANVMAVRVRGEVKNGQFPEAIESIKTMFAIADSFNKHPTLIGSLVGIAIASMATNLIEEMVQQPGCPNLYWGLVDLPKPLITMRTALQGEPTFLGDEVSRLVKLTRPLSDTEFDQIKKFFESFGLPDSEINSFLGLPQAYVVLAFNKSRVEQAKQRLTAYGYTKDALDSMPPTQAVVLDDFRQYTEIYDERRSLLNLPMHIRQVKAEQYEKSMAGLQKHNQAYLTSRLIPAISRLYASQMRLEQRLAYLQTIEAVRLHAYDNDGKLPSSLDDLDYWVPNDPATGKSFEYSLKDGVATLTGGNPDRQRDETNRVYQLRIQAE